MGNTVNRINKRGGPMTAPAIETYIHALYRNASIVNENTIKLIKTLFTELKRIKSCGDNERRELWLEVPRGSIEDFGDYESAREFEDVENYEEFESWWKEEYPEESYWYHLVTVENDGYMAVFLKNHLVLEVNPKMFGEQYDSWGEAVTKQIITTVAIYLLKSSIRNMQMVVITV